MNVLPDTILFASAPAGLLIPLCVFFSIGAAVVVSLAIEGDLRFSLRAWILQHLQDNAWIRRQRRRGKWSPVFGKRDSHEA
jgi:hypothetical protein